jgi:hypothetical protein
LHAETGWEEGPVTVPKKEVIRCRAAVIQKGGAVAEKTMSFDVTSPNDLKQVRLLSWSDVNVTFSTYGDGISVYIHKGDRPGDLDNTLASASTSLGPIRDGRSHKLYVLTMYQDKLVHTACNYSEYVP